MVVKDFFSIHFPAASLVNKITQFGTQINMLTDYKTDLSIVMGVPVSRKHTDFPLKS